MSMPTNIAPLPSPLPRRMRGACRSDIAPSLATPRDYFELLKPRVMSLVVFTALVGMVVAPGHINPVIGCHGVDVHRDRRGRVRRAEHVVRGRHRRDHVAHRQAPDPARPYPAAARCSASRLFLAVVFGDWLWACWSTVLSAALLAFTIFFYAVIYSMWLKPSTPQNIVIGGAAGAFPPMIGWAAATGTVGARTGRDVPDHLRLDAAAFLGAGPAARRRICARRRADAAGGRGRARDAPPDRALFLLLAPVGALPLLLGYTGAALWRGRRSWAASCSSPRHGACARRREGEATERAAKALFGYSILYLVLLFAVLLVEQGSAGRSGGCVVSAVTESPNSKASS